MITQSIDTYYGESSTGSRPRAGQAQDLGRDTFLKLLVAQLQNQDPLNPLQGQEFASQLAQFSSLEQLSNMNAALGGIQQSLTADHNDNSLDYIGRTVKVRDTTLALGAEGPVSAAYDLESDADVAVTIYDAQGTAVRHLPVGWQAAGAQSLAWDGRDDLGHRVSRGDYTFEIDAFDPDGAAVAADAYRTGEVGGVTYRAGVPYLMVGDRPASLDEIVEIKKTE